MGVKIQGFGLVKENEQTKRIVNFDIQQSGKLYNALKTARCLTGARTPIKSWANEFRLLRKHITKREIKRTLNWYVAHLKDEYVPKAHSAKSFRAKFGAIVEAMDRASPFVDKIKISDEARRIQARAALHWPSGEGREELAFIQICLDNYKAIQAKIKLLSDQYRMKLGPNPSSREEQNARLFERVLAHMPAPCDFVRWWLEEVNKTANQWRGWTGQLRNWVLHLNHPKVQHRLHALIADYTDSVNRHDFFDKAMRGE